MLGSTPSEGTENSIPSGSNPCSNVVEKWSNQDQLNQMSVTLPTAAQTCILPQIAPNQKALVSLQVFWNRLNDPNWQSQLWVVAMQFSWTTSFLRIQWTQIETPWHKYEILTVSWLLWGSFAPPAAYAMFVHNWVCLSSLPGLKFHQSTLWPFWTSEHIIKKACTLSITINKSGQQWAWHHLTLQEHFSSVFDNWNGRLRSSKF